MKFTCKVLFLLLLFLFFSISAFSELKNNPLSALVYNGKYADADASEAVAKLAAKFKLDVKYFSNPDQIVKNLTNTKMIIIGGTQDNIEPLIKSFTPDIIKAIKEFLNHGGRYLGICGGAYLASTGWEEDSGFVKALGLLPVETDSYSSDPEPKVISVRWKNVPRTIYYQFGPNFFPDDTSGTKIIARYDDGSIAACMGKAGNGKVYLCGPHPEADDTWIEDDMENASSWKPTIDLADDMMKDILKD